MIDLQALKNSLTDQAIIQIMADLGSPDYKETSTCLIFHTICHNCDAVKSSMKLYYYRETKEFHCYTDCACNFNIYTLFEKRYKLLGIQYKFFDIVNIISQKSGSVQNASSLFYESRRVSTREQEYGYNTLPESTLLSCFDFDPTIGWLMEGISEESMRRYNILYSQEENKIIIPHYDIEGHLIGIRGRALSPDDVKRQGKYFPITIEGKTYSHATSYNLYGLNIVKNNISAKKIAIVAESEKACLQYDSMVADSDNICVGACGNHFSDPQLRLLKSVGAEHILLAFDQDGKTKEEREKTNCRIRKICEKYKNFCSIGYVQDKDFILKDKESPFDRGVEVAKKLINEGVWVS